MKKLIYGTFILAIVGIGVVSCEKEEIAETENKTVIQPERTLESTLDESTIIDQHLYPGLSVENGVLSFESIEYYESLVDEESQFFCVDALTQYLNEGLFNAYGKNHPQNSEYLDPFMDAIMNLDKVVKIGEWFIYIDAPSETVRAISDEVSNAYTTLLTNTTSEDVIVMTTTDDVLDELSEGAGQDRNGFCGESGVAARYDQANFGVPGSDINRARLEHRKYGVYFKIQVRIFTPSVINQIVKLNFVNKSYKKTCQSMVNMSLTPYSTPVFHGGSYPYVLTSGTRNFNKYWIRISAGERGTSGYAGYVKDADLDRYLEIRANM